MHSWHALILAPFVYQHELYEQYRFDEPWDGPNNSQLADRMPRTFHMPKRFCPAMQMGTPSETDGPVIFIRAVTKRSWSKTLAAIAWMHLDTPSFAVRRHHQSAGWRKTVQEVEASLGLNTEHKV